MCDKGQNLILNMNDKGFTVVAYNRTTSKVDAFLANEAKGKSLHLPPDGRHLTPLEAQKSRVLIRFRSWSLNSNGPARLSFSSRREMLSMISSSSSSLIWRKVISS